MISSPYAHRPSHAEATLRPWRLVHIKPNGVRLEIASFATYIECEWMR